MTKKKSHRELINSPTFCTLAWTGLSVSPSGSVTPCCLYEDSIKTDQKSHRIYKDDISTFYNGSFMKDIRRKMLNNEFLDGCKQCYESEKYGGISLRKRANADEWDCIEDYGLDEDYIPQSIDLKLNNTCNLKCRMCQPRDSIQIYSEFSKIMENDPNFKYFQNSKLTDPELQIDLKDVPNWENDESFFDQIRSALPGMRKLSIVGGEPLILDSLYKLLDLIVESGHSKHIFLVITTNLMTLRRDRIKEYFSQFEEILIQISLDAVGRELSYIRHPSDFKKIEKNFRDLYDHPKVNDSVTLCFALTSQLYNAIYIVDVFKFVEALLKEGILLSDQALAFTYLTYPRHLDIKNLPDKLRKVAIKELEEFEKSSTMLIKQESFRQGFNQLLHTIKNEKNSDRKKLLNEFLYYSNTLDKQRNQSLQEALPDFYNGLIESKVKAVCPKPDFHMLREEGWELASADKLTEAIVMFEAALKTSTSKQLDYRELGWMYMKLESFSLSYKNYKKAFSLEKNDPYILKGFAIIASILEKNRLCKKLLPLALELNPGDNELIEIQNRIS